MALINWNDTYSVGIADMDKQHQKLIGLINSFHDAMKEGRAQNVIGKVLEDLKIYTEFHFNDEEKLMKKYAYPGYDGQKNEHNSFVTKLNEFIQHYGEGQLTAVSLDVSQFLKDWLLNHISRSDKKYGKYLNSKGVK